MPDIGNVAWKEPRSRISIPSAAPRRRISAVSKPSNNAHLIASKFDGSKQHTETLQNGFDTLRFQPQPIRHRQSRSDRGCPTVPAAILGLVVPLER
jgi:hypothetical protein